MMTGAASSSGTSGHSGLRRGSVGGATIGSASVRSLSAQSTTSLALVATQDCIEKHFVIFKPERPGAPLTDAQKQKMDYTHLCE